MTSERVAVVDRADVEQRWGRLQGHFPVGLDDVIYLEQRLRWEDREIAEVERAWLQIIPYAAVVSEGQVFVMQRLAGGGESRLRGRISIGVGGHINPVDGPAVGAMQRALARELREEVGLERFRPRLLGRVHDGSTAVGAVHLGITWLVSPSDPSEVRVLEDTKLSGGFAPLNGEWRTASNLETWSALLAQSLAEMRN